MVIKKKRRSDLSGVLGEQVTLDKVNGRVVAKNRPERKQGPLSQKQTVHRVKFQTATQYAKNVMEKPEVKAMYEAGRPEGVRSAFNAAFRDFLRPPRVLAINTRDYTGKAGETLKVDAIDDFKVVKVKVEIRDGSGALLEKGDATAGELIPSWFYTAKKENPMLAGTTIEATAFDFAGNQGTLKVTL